MNDRQEIHIEETDTGWVVVLTVQTDDWSRIEQVAGLNLALASALSGDDTEEVTH